MPDVDEMTTVGRVVAGAATLPRWATVCVPELSPVAGEDPCVVVDCRDLDDDEDVPPVAIEAGLTRSMMAEQLQDVVDNAAQQVGSPTAEQLLDALNHFLLADAFITFDGDDGTGRLT